MSARRIHQVVFDHERFAVIFNDAQSYAGEMMVLAPGVTTDGHKRISPAAARGDGERGGRHVPVGRVAETRRADQCADLVRAGRCQRPYERPSLACGASTPSRSGQVHKLRNVQAHLAEERHEELRKRLNAAYHETNETQARTLLKSTIAWLRKFSPAAAASLEEGWEETLTVVRLGVAELLRKTLATTNTIESAFSVAESVTRRVKRWRDGTMRERWCVAGLLDAESRFRRVKGHKHMKDVLNALVRVVHPTLDAERQRA